MVNRYQGPNPKGRLMLKTRIIPCLDVADGRVVKGVNFVNLIDAGDPVEQAKLYAGYAVLRFIPAWFHHINRNRMYYS